MQWWKAMHKLPHTNANFSQMVHVQEQLGGTHLNVAILLRKLAQVDLLRAPETAALLRYTPWPCLTALYA